MEVSLSCLDTEQDLQGIDPRSEADGVVRSWMWVSEAVALGVGFLGDT